MSTDPIYEGGIDYTPPTTKQRMQIESWRERRQRERDQQEAERNND